MGEVILDALLDTLKLFPFLFVIYIIIELLEHKTSLSEQHERLRGPLAPLIGTATGLIPQCGFSVMAAKLYDKKMIRTGTLLAVFLATSDEAFIILLSSGAAGAKALLPMIISKLVIALLAGYIANLVIPDKEVVVADDHDEEVHSCGREHTGISSWKVYFWNPLKHTLLIAAYILGVNLIFGFLTAWVGEDRIMQAMNVGGKFVQPLMTALVGLIPNCVSSVIITQSFLDGWISFGSCVAGLCTNAGLGFFVLLKNTKETKRNLLLILATWMISAASGIILNLFI